MGILYDEGEPGVEAGSEEATCRQRATKESMKMLQTEERTKECDSRGELGDMGVVAGDGAESQDQEVRAQRYRRELGEEERRDIDEERVLSSYSNTVFVAHLSERRSTAVVRGDPKRSRRQPNGRLRPANRHPPHPPPIRRRKASGGVG